MLNVVNNTTRSEAVQEQMIRWPAVKAMTGLSRSTVWRLETTTEFPRRRQISGKCVAWVETEVRAWIATRPAVHRANQAIPRPMAPYARSGSNQP